MTSNDTVELLKQCDAGSKMAVSAIDEVIDKVRSPQLKELLSESKQHHSILGNELHSLLTQHHSDDKEPTPMAKGMSWLKTNWKLGMDENDATIADLITDGCDMGVKSLNKYLNQYRAADEISKDICRRLIAIEEELVKSLRTFL